MEAIAPSPVSRSFVERRKTEGTASAPDRERRQFANSYEELTSDAMELARAIDSYKLAHRRRFINFEEMLGIIKSLGYSK